MVSMLSRLLPQDATSSEHATGNALAAHIIGAVERNAVALHHRANGARRWRLAGDGDNGDQTDSC